MVAVPQMQCACHLSTIAALAHQAPAAARPHALLRRCRCGRMRRTRSSTATGSPPTASLPWATAARRRRTRCRRWRRCVKAQAGKGGHGRRGRHSRHGRQAGSCAPAARASTHRSRPSAPKRLFHLFHPIPLASMEMPTPQVAEQQGKYLARVLNAAAGRLEADEPEPFQYRHLGSMASIGARRRLVLRVGRCALRRCVVLHAAARIHLKPKHFHLPADHTNLRLPPTSPPPFPGQAARLRCWSWAPRRSRCSRGAASAAGWPGAGGGSPGRGRAAGGRALPFGRAGCLLQLLFGTKYLAIPCPFFPQRVPHAVGHHEAPCLRGGRLDPHPPVWPRHQPLVARDAAGWHAGSPGQPSWLVVVMHLTVF